jgi:tetratricopeptide (TPR) repeat protein
MPFFPPVPAGVVQKPPGVSLCMIVKNEEAFLPQCLASIKDYVDEIIVCDTGSSDRTIEIARSFGATVVEREWRNDFGWARNESLAAATKRWIIFLDADEELRPESGPVLLALKTVPAHETALWVRIYNRTDDYRGSGEVSHALIRVFPNSERIRFRGTIHEYPSIDGKLDSIEAVPSGIEIVHHGYMNEVVNARNKGERNLSILQAATQAEPDNPYHWYNLGTTAYLVSQFEVSRDALERMRAIVGSGSRAFMPNGLTLLASLYCDTFGDPVKGEQIAREALARSPHYANGHMMLGKTLAVQRRFEDARAALLEAIADAPYAKQQFIVDDQIYVWKAQSEIGSTYAEEKNDVKALEWYEKGLANAPTVEPLMLNRARALERLGRMNDAYDAYRAALEAHGSAQSLLNFVNYLLRVQKNEESLRVVDRWHHRLNPAHASELLVGAAGVCERFGIGDARGYLQRALELDPSNEKAREHLRRLSGASKADLTAAVSAALAAKDGAAALAAADAAIALEGSDIGMLLGRAAALELLGSHAGVEASLLQARELDPQRAAVALSMFYLRNERFAEAAAVAERALQ